MSKAKKQQRITRKPQQSIAPKRQTPPAQPVGPQKIAIDQVKFLKFRETKLREEILKLQESKLAADQRIIDVTKENVELRRKLTMTDIKGIYGECGIQDGDQVVMDGDGFAIIRPGPTMTPVAPKAVTDEEEASTLEGVEEDEE